MKHLRCALALLLCLLLVSASSLAAAAQDPFTAVPSLKITTDSAGIASRATGAYTLTTDVPGFVTVRLLDAGGSEVMTLCDAVEIHTNDNIMSITARDEDRQGLPEGQYTLSAELVSQFGVSSGAVTAALLITAPASDEDEEEEEEDEAGSAPSTAKSPAADEDDAGDADSEDADDQKSAASSSGSSASSGKTTTGKTTSSKTTSNVVSYTSGSGQVGDEGLMIGVGVTDMADQGDMGYWSLDSDATDAEIWAALTRNMMGVNVGENESAYIYDSPEKGRSRLGTVSGLSQGLNVITNRDDGWSLVEAYRNEDGAFVRGYILTNKLRLVEPNTTYGLVVDKATQTLTVFKDGERIGSCDVTTGLPTSKYLHRETPAGEFITVTRRGTTEYYGNGYSKYTIRINGSYYLCEIPTTKKNGSDFSLLEDSLGEKATRGNVCLAHDASSDGGINAEWIWNMTDANKKVKVLIFDDKDRGEVPVGE